MGFEVFVCRRTDAVVPGQCSINAAGMIVLSAVDLRRAGVKDRCVVLIDAATRRLAVRQPKDDGGLAEPSLRLRMNKTGTTATIQVSGALREINCPPPKCKGRYEAMFKDDLIIVQVGDPSRRAKA